MRMINNHRFYDEEDIYGILYTLDSQPQEIKNLIRKHIIQAGYGMDAIPLLNIINDPMEYSMDYLNSLDSDVTEELIAIAEWFGLG